MAKTENAAPVEPLSLPPLTPEPKRPEYLPERDPLTPYISVVDALTDLYGRFVMTAYRLHAAHKREVAERPNLRDGTRIQRVTIAEEDRITPQEFELLCDALRNRFIAKLSHIAIQPPGRHLTKITIDPDKEPAVGNMMMAAAESWTKLETLDAIKKIFTDAIKSTS